MPKIDNHRIISYQLESVSLETTFEVEDIIDHFCNCEGQHKLGCPNGEIVTFKEPDHKITIIVTDETTGKRARMTAKLIDKRWEDVEEEVPTYEFPEVNRDETPVAPNHVAPTPMKRSFWKMIRGIK